MEKELTLFDLPCSTLEKSKKLNQQKYASLISLRIINSDYLSSMKV